MCVHFASSEYRLPYVIPTFAGVAASIPDFRFKRILSNPPRVDYVTLVLAIVS
jgi:hypothetical protein